MSNYIICFLWTCTIHSLASHLFPHIYIKTIKFIINIKKKKKRRKLYILCLKQIVNKHLFFFCGHVLAVRPKTIRWKICYNSENMPKAIENSHLFIVYDFVQIAKFITLLYDLLADIECVRVIIFPVGYSMTITFRLNKFQSHIFSLNKIIRENIKLISNFLVFFA